MSISRKFCQPAEWLRQHVNVFELRALGFNIQWLAWAGTLLRNRFRERVFSVSEETVHGISLSELQRSASERIGVGF